MRGHPRLLLLLRHAKAEPYGTSDAERRLTDRGRRQAVAAGVHLREADAVPQVAMVSSAARTPVT